MRHAPLLAATVVVAALATPAAADALAPLPAPPTPTVSVSATTVPALSKSRTARIVVRNTGSTAANGLSLAVAWKKGVKVTIKKVRKGSQTRRLRPLKAGGTVTVRATLRRTKGGPRRGSLALRVKRSGKVVAKSRLAFGGSSGATTDPNSLAGRYFWGSTFTLSGTDQKTLYFTSKNLVFVADAEGVVPDCSGVSEVCRPYTYDAATKRLTVDGKTGTLDGRKGELDGQTYFEFAAPPAGTRWTAYVTYVNSFGLCPTSCTYVREDLTFRPDGTFVRGGVTSGTSPSFNFAAVPPDRKGTYEVRADGTIRLAFADGKVRIETVAVYRKDDGSLEGAEKGLLLNGDGYFDVSD